MGLFTGLLTLPLAPVRGVVWVADQVTQEAERQLYDEASIRAELLALELAAEDGALSDEELHAREDELLERLAVSRARQTAPTGAADPGPASRAPQATQVEERE